MSLLQKGENLVRVSDVGKIGVIKDIPINGMPLNSWTDALNIRFLDDSAYQAWGWIIGRRSENNREILHVMDTCATNTEETVGPRVGIYFTGVASDETVYNAGVMDNIGWSSYQNRKWQIPANGVKRNSMTSTTLGGIPVFNSYSAVSIAQRGTRSSPQYFDYHQSSQTAIPIRVINSTTGQATFVKSIRSFRDILIALNLELMNTGNAKVSGGSLRSFTLWWSDPADPGSMPASWDVADPTKLAGQFTIADGNDFIVDGLTLRDSFMVYKERSTWRLDYIGGNNIFSVSKVFSDVGVMGLNCVCEFDNQHFVVGQSDVVTHDGQFATSILDKRTRRFLFKDINNENASQTFVFRNTAMNEIFICYATKPGDVACDKALVWNYRDKTVSFRQLPDINSACACAASSVKSLLNPDNTFDTIKGSWNEQIRTWDGNTPIQDGMNVVMASKRGAIYILDMIGTLGGTAPDDPPLTAFLERKGISFDRPEMIKTIRGIRPHIEGIDGTTVKIKIGSQDRPNGRITWKVELEYVIGQTIVNDFKVSGRYLAIRFETGTAKQWKLDSYEIDVVLTSET